MSLQTQRPDSERPTRIRHLVVFVTFLAAFLLYLHRFCMSYMQRYIKEDLMLTDEQLGYCFSAFFFSYALAQVPSGWLSDRFGARIMLSFYILIWSAFTGLMGLSVGFIMLLVVRMAAGLGQAGAYPTSAALLSRWIPFSHRGTASGIVAFGGRLGGGLAPILTVSMIVAFVPTDKSSTLTNRDLLDSHYLCYRMFSDDDTVAPLSESSATSESPSDRIAHQMGQKLSPANQEFALHLAQIYATAASQKGASQTGRYDRSFSQTMESPDPAKLQSLLDNLNNLLQSSDLYNEADFKDIPLEREAKQLAARNDSLSLEEQSRLNRLLLEAIFPNAIKKIYASGWRLVMFVYGSFGLVVAGLFWFCFRDQPADHPRCNEAEVALIRGSSSTTNQTEKSKPVGGVPLKHILRSRSLWLMCVSQWGGNVGWVFLVTWLPRYLFEVHSVPLLQRGLMAAIPLWVGWLGMLAGGPATDRITRRLGLRWRMLPMVVGRFVAMTAYIACTLHLSAWGVTAVLAAVAFSNDFCNPSSWAYKQDVGGKHVGSVHGWANMWGNFGATISPILLQYIISHYSWNAAFITCAASFSIAGTYAFFVDARIPVVPDENT